MGEKKKIVKSQTLEVDTWKKKTYDSNDNLTEEEGEKKPITEVMELKYLGLVISSFAKNVPNILDRKRRQRAHQITL